MDDIFNALLIDLPDTVETPRLRLRCPQPGDGIQVHAAVMESLPELRQWPASLPWAMVEPSVESSEIFCRHAQAEFLARRVFPMLVFLQDGTLVGSCGLQNPRWSVPAFEVGFWCRTRWTGQGLMTEALQAVVDHAQAHLRAQRLDCLTDEGNVRSRRLCERAGFQLEGVLRHERRAPDGTLRNTCVYARLA